ncbi:Outer membrane protein (porin) [Rhodoblastus acidophilus]|uniref:Outer membrane protein (Porin) n=1 Tax=Rhodoblastus acidophilus TaxID=1074 RepID=A0A212RLX1_RHOAC|nr:porin [Rhodoblastus acidophilus]RAI24168.1 porin [Rhodoblastus acidophilus]SNB73468.1 Outer membrane protein (porin) [Rhodoblastus acidophilus]
MKSKFMTAVAIAALVTAAGAVSAEAKTKKVKHAKAPAPVAAPVVKGPAVEGPSRLDAFVTTGDALAFLTDSRDISWNGVTIFGALDFGAGWMAHATDLEKTVPQGQAYLGSRNNQHNSGFRFMPGGLGYNQVGIKGAWTIAEGTKFIFNATTNFDPYTLSLLDGPRSLQRAAGKYQNAYPYFDSDSSRGGQPFNNELYAGFKNDTFGQLTFGRHTNMVAESTGNFDPLKNAVALSLIGFSGSLASGGTTEAGKLDNSLKYKVAYGPVYGGAMVTLADSQGVASQGVSYGFNLGGTYAGFALDGAYQHTTDAIALGAIPNASGTVNGVSVANATAAANGWLVGTLSDNDAFSIGTKYTWTQWTGFFGYENISQTNATDRKAVSSTTSYYDGNDYRYFITTANPFPHTKHIDLFWGGVSYAYSDKLTLTGAYYHAEQNAYGTTKCSTPTNGNCSGNYDVASFLTQYAFNKRMQVYGGVSYSAATGGFGANWNERVNWNPMVGFRMTF